MTTRWTTLLAIDFDRHAAATYAANFPDTEVRCASVADELDRLYWVYQGSIARKASVA